MRDEVWNLCPDGTLVGGIARRLGLVPNFPLGGLFVLALPEMRSVEKSSVKEEPAGQSLVPMPFP